MGKKLKEIYILSFTNIKVLLKIQKERLLVLLICQKNIEELLLERKEKIDIIIF